MRSGPTYMATTMKLWMSSENGQVVCDQHRPLYGDIPWHRMTEREQVAFRIEICDFVAADEPLCEMCRHAVRRERVGAAR